MPQYALVLKGAEGFNHDTIVTIEGFGTTQDEFIAKRLANDEKHNINMDEALALDGVSRVTVDIPQLKAGSLFYELAFDETTNEVTGYDSKGHRHVIDVMYLERIEE